MTSNQDFLDLFAPEAPDAPPPATETRAVWKILLVDDDEDIHTVLHMALRNVQVENRPLALLDARSGKEARALLAAHPEIALVLLDVVMETELEGLNLVRHVRQELGNRMVQIVLVTGQPGYAPERDVVADYAIDGYRLKSELTADKIFVSVYVALRTYKALCDSEHQRQQLERLSQALGEKEERMRSVVETAPDAIVQFDASGLVVGWNEGARHLFGYDAQQMQGQSLALLMPQHQRAQHAENMRRLADGADAGLLGRVIEMNGLRANGEEFPIELVLGTWRSASGPHFSAVIRDVSERRRTEAGLRLAASVYANSYEGIIIADANKAIVDINPAFTRITGYAKDEVLGRTPKLLSSGRHDAAFYQAMWASIAEHDFWQGEVTNRRRDGRLYTEILSISVIRDEQGTLQHYIGVFSDITLLKAHEDELYRIAHYDHLTNLPNRRLFSDRLAQALARSRRSEESVAVCYLDLDGFKAVNDSHGHAVGDQLLIELSRRLQGVLRSDDTLARLGGDEFVLLLASISGLQECQSALERVLEVVATPMEIEGKRVAVTASIGVTVYPADPVDADTLMRHADQAMYLAKEGGKNSFHFFDPVHDQQVQTQRHYMQRLRQALDQGEFVLHYQPKVDLLDGTVMGFEALIRWQHPQDGLLAPGVFLHYLEGSELEILVGEWVLQSVVQQIAAWRDAGIQVTVSANISADHLLRSNFAERLEQILAAYPRAVAECLELEILETAALADLKRAVQTITQCRKLGVQFSLDDFGTGYSSLTYFLNLPVQVLKIDQSFVKVMLDDPGGLGIVESVVRLAQAFNRPVIAEGVETLEHGGVLLRFGCRFAQGYGIARPMAVAQVRDWMAQWQATAAWRGVAAQAADGDIMFKVAARSSGLLLDAIALQLQQQEEVAVPLNAEPENCSFCRWFRSAGFTSYGQYPEYQDVAVAHERGHALALLAQKAHREGNKQECQQRLAALQASKAEQTQALQRLQQRARPR
ncbi:MAG: EAL domain-containing protein [Rhodoferax sp.]|nr:EAL domain-containing protein [Rhodoferax sp.]